MATIEVSTWAQLVSAIDSASAGDTIKLIADIDCNREIPEGVTSSISSMESYTIDGSYEEDGVTKNHEIRNLRTATTSPVTIFAIDDGSWTIKNIDFLNLILDKPLITLRSYSTARTSTIRNCRFTGKRTDYLFAKYENNGMTTINMYSSYINLPYYGTSNDKASLCDFYSSGTKYFRSYMNNCRIIESFNDTYTPNTVIYGGISNSNLNGCRVEGTLIGSTVWDGNYQNINITRNAYTPTMQNVLECDVYITVTSTITPKLNIAPLGVVKVPVYYKDGTQVTLATVSSGIIAATESQMQDTSWLIQQGFDVVPSNI